MAHRTTILLGEDARRAARNVATTLEITPAEAVWRAVVAYRDQILGVPHGGRQRRLAAFKRVTALFADNDPEAEIRALKAQDPFF
jgi:hypothetical protein